MNSAELDVATWFAGMARTLSSRGGVAETLQEMCRLAVEVIEPCTDAGVSQSRPGERIETPAATSDTARMLHDIQYELNDGPCLEAAWEEHTVHVPDMAAERRWPTFAERAGEAGVGSMLCFRLFTHRGTLGALNLFSDRANAFDSHDRELGLAFASHAAVALAAVQNEAGLTSAIATRQLIGEATGILAERHQLSTTDAFRMLAHASQERNIKLRDLAERLVKTEDAARPQRNR